MNLRLPNFSFQLSAFFAAAAAGGDSGEIVTLPEFQVTAASTEDDYIITEATSGTRLGEDINKLPFNIDIITSKNIRVLEVSASETGLNDDDHYPVIATFSIE